MSKPVLLVTAPVATRSGYGAHARDIVRSLIELDKYDVKIWNVRWGTTPLNALDKSSERDKPIIDRLLSSPQLPNQPDIHIHIVVPNEFSPIGKYNIGITAGLECTVAPPDWVQGLNKMDMNIVPSTFVSNTFRNLSFDIKDEKTQQLKGVLKLEKPMEVLFEGIDSRVYKKTKEFSKELVTEMKSIQETFNFLYVGHWLQGRLGEDRKDTGMLVKVFLETFKNQKVKPGLILKTSGAGFSVLDREDILKKIRDIRNSVSGDLPNVYLLSGEFSDQEMNELYNHPKVKAMLSLTKGEGFGRPLLEFGLTGKPIMASGWSGHMDFLNPEYTSLLPGTLEPVHESAANAWLIKEAKWFKVSEPHVGTTLKNLYKYYKKFLERSRKQKHFAKTNFSWENMRDLVDTILEDNLPEFAEQVQLQMPKLELPKLEKLK